MAGTWKSVTSTPTFNVSTMLLLTDGSVLSQNMGTNEWWLLTPSSNGSYDSGEWRRVQSGPNAPLYYASAVLADGTVFLAGGEDNGATENADLCTVEVYDPVSDTWTDIDPPAGWTAIGDAPCCVLSDGRVLLGSIDDNKCAIYDPTSKSFTATGAKQNVKSSEETWTLLRNGGVLSLDCYAAAGKPTPGTEQFLDDAWKFAGTTPDPLVEPNSHEVGPAILLNDGRLLAIGATGKTALYTPDPDPLKPGIWTSARDLPRDSTGRQLGAKDAPACLLPNGRVLLAVGPADGPVDSYDGPTQFFEFDPTTGVIAAIINQPANTDPKMGPYTARLLLLPTGEVLFSDGTPGLQIYRPDGTPDAQAAPAITACPSRAMAGSTHKIRGLQLNGLSQACSYGDDATMATNYPIVRLRDQTAGSIYYCRTAGHSSMGVATGRAPQSTNFTIPASVPPGSYALSVVANGIASSEVGITVTAYVAAAMTPGVAADPSAASNGISPDMAQCVEDAQYLLVYSAKTGIDLDDATTEAILVANQRVRECAPWRSADEGSLLDAVRKLSQTVKPVTAATLRASLDLKPAAATLAFGLDRDRTAATASKTVREFRYQTLFALVALLVVQIYWLIGATTTAEIQQLRKPSPDQQTSIVDAQKEAESKGIKSGTPEYLNFLQDKQKQYITLHQSEINDINTRITTASNILMQWAALPNLVLPKLPNYLSNYLFGADTQEPASPAASGTGIVFGHGPSQNLLISTIALDATSRFFLPLLYGLLGASVYVLRSLAQDVKALTFSPDSVTGLRLRIYLGMLAGLAATWFVSPSSIALVGGSADATGQTTSTVTATLSPLALCFLAGYSIDLLFAAMDRIISVFDLSGKPPSKTT